MGNYLYRNHYYTRDIPESSIGNHLNPKELLTKQQISDFFIEELKKIRDQL